MFGVQLETAGLRGHNTRSAVLYGTEGPLSKNSALRLARKGPGVKIVHDGMPTKLR